jgi:phosphatidylserine decarboxylase
LFKENIHILFCEIIFLLITILGWKFLRSRILAGLSILLVVAIVFTVFFFRDPERITPAGQGVVVSPADGRIVVVKEVTNLSFSESPLNMVSIFLTLWDVHVNRIPISGKVSFVKYSPGRFLPAFIGKSSTRNEQNIIGIDGEMGRLFIKQIAGLIARRIVCRLRVGDRVNRGERFGMIRFGSRIELFLPTSVKIEVARGQRVKGGISIIGKADEA